ncbi:hypothetical protein C5C95_06190 [Rathayibacter sp. AY1B7]|uniref:phage tail tube protein n=1 Tax=Rathayibacter sp. AY1B7 TaxID=2080532 RepID=UPI000CE8A5B1|nr:hypothetical protein [Rathayibacter sp. AY1B7]PPH99730.1 hypothetical protein C5C95_06190 [Rathayibacter sp. AY1B7]
MPVSNKSVFVGAPDQKATGAILTGPEIEEMFDSIDDFSDAELEDSGYVNEDGVTITPSDSTESIKDWSQAEIRRILTEFTGEISWTHLELNAQSARNYFGDDNVEVTAATTTKGTQMRASLGRNELPIKARYFKVKDGDRRVLVVAPRSQIVSRGEIPLTATGAITLPVTLATYPDAAGQNIYIFTDDGVVSAAA